MALVYNFLHVHFAHSFIQNINKICFQSFVHRSKIGEGDLSRVDLLTSEALYEYFVYVCRQGVGLCQKQPKWRGGANFFAGRNSCSKWAWLVPYMLSSNVVRPSYTQTAQIVCFVSCPTLNPFNLREKVGIYERKDDKKSANFTHGKLVRKLKHCPPARWVRIEETHIFWAIY